MSYKHVTPSLPMTGGVYDLIKLPNGQYSLSYKGERFHSPPKLYGELNYLYKLLADNIRKEDYKGGIMLLGSPGSGKTELAKAICNELIKDGFNVVNINDIQFDANLIDFLDTLDDVVYFWDEFGKNFNTEEQNKLLTLLSNVYGKRRVNIITENEKFRITDYILNRPGRIKYSLAFDKIPLSTVTEYLEDMGIDEYTANDIIKLYYKSLKFTFDHLKAIVTEALNHPELKLEEILNYLNIDFLKPKKILKIGKVLVDSIDITHACFFREDLPYELFLAKGYIEMVIDIPRALKQPDEKKDRNDEKKQRINKALETLPFDWSSTLDHPVKFANLSQFTLTRSTDNAIYLKKDNIEVILPIIKKYE